jgi:retron-type reverse transcriptase
VGKSDQKGKPFTVPEQLVWEAYRRVKANKGAAGVDRVSVEGFEEDLRGNLYKILGVPTVGDRIAQTVVALQLEARTESIFHPDSYGVGQ